MKNIRILLISIPAIIIISAVIGCAITFSSAPHAALARLFIDLGALIALVLITYSLPKPEVLHTDDIVDGLRDLACNRFDRRLSVKEQDELFPVRQAFNELAGTLSDRGGQSLTHIRYNPKNRIELRVTPLPSPAHSHHPELGQVKTAEELAMSEMPAAAIQQREEVLPEPVAEASAMNETIEESVESVVPMANIESAPPAPAPAEQEVRKSEVREERPETYPSGIGAADLFFLFERFKAAHDHAATPTAIDFDDFISTVQKAREDLIKSHRCRDVKFEVVTEAGAVALRPRLIR